MQIKSLSIFGLGYVGCVSAACLTQNGIRVIGVDKNTQKVDLINQGKAPIVEPSVAQMLLNARKAKLLTATTNIKSALNQSQAALICVGTPSEDNGHLNIDYVMAVTEQIAQALRLRKEPFIMIYRSTLEPGTMNDKVMPLLNKILKSKLGKIVHVVYQPEFLREGVAVKDYYDPGKTVVGGASDVALNAVLALYHGKTGPVFKTSIKNAEMVKVADNIFHALKIAFGNEIGVLARKLGVNAQDLMDMFIADTRLNISAKYLRPGKPFGGSCLPKELRCVRRLAMELDCQLPVITNILESNELRKEDVVRLITSVGSKRVGFIGLSFKEDTDDLRESPAVDWVETLLGKGYDVSIFDPHVNYAKLMGSNKDYLDKHLPHINQLLVNDVNTLIKRASVVVIVNKQSNMDRVVKMLSSKHHVIDLVGLKELFKDSRVTYQGLYW